MLTLGSQIRRERDGARSHLDERAQQPRPGRAEAVVEGAQGGVAEHAVGLLHALEGLRAHALLLVRVEVPRELLVRAWGVAFMEGGVKRVI